MEYEPPPVACSLRQADLPGRADSWRALADRALSRVSPTPRGLLLVFGAGPGVADELEALAALERDCCAFATWSVRVDSTEIILEVSGDGDEAVTAIQSMFAALG